MIALPGASENLRELAARGVQRSYAKGRLLIEEGDVGDTLFIILRGRLRVFSLDPVNDRELTFGSYGPGEYVGELSLDGRPRSASVEALDSSVCAVVTRRTLETFIAERPTFAFELLEKVIARVRAATLTASTLVRNDVYGRLKLLLETESRSDGESTRRIDPRPTHKELRSWLGCSREMVSRILKDLERGGHVHYEGRAIVVRVPLPARW